MPRHLVGLEEEEHASGADTLGDGSIGGLDQGVGLVALASRHVLSLWAVWRRSRLQREGAAAAATVHTTQGGKGGGRVGRESGSERGGSGASPGGAGGLGCALMAIVTPSSLLHGGADDAPFPHNERDWILCVDWVHAASAAVATGSSNGAVDILVFRSRSIQGAVGAVGSLRIPLGWMEVAVRVCPPGGLGVRHISCCSGADDDGSAGAAEADGVPPTCTVVVAKGSGIWCWDACRYVEQ